MQRVRYRKKKYRSGRIKAIVFISIAVIVVLVVLFLAIGLSFADKTKDYEIPEDFVPPSTDVTDEKAVASVQAFPLPLLEDGSSFSSRLAGIDESAQAVCISLNKPNGTLLYRSSLASKLSYLSVEPDASSLTSYIKSITDEDLYITATLYIPTFKELKEDGDELMADVELSIWGSIACEAIRAGVNDVLLIANGADAEDAQKLSALAERIHITEKNATVGLCIPNEFFEAEKSASLIDSLSKKFDYLALDATSPTGDGTLLQNVEAAISDKQLQLMYYKMRVLLPRGANAEELATLADLVKRYSIASWQSVPN